VTWANAIQPLRQRNFAWYFASRSINTLGNMMATGVLFVLAAVQSDADFEAWGWRIAFAAGAALAVVVPAASSAMASAAET